MLIDELNKERTDIFYQTIANLWNSGSFFTYKNEVTDSMGNEYFIRINKDGSEDLVKLGYNEEKSWVDFIENISPPETSEIWLHTKNKGYLTL